MESFRSKTRRPTHPGAILREDVLPELNITHRNLLTGWACRAARFLKS